jgi:Peptidase family C25/Secretion system C-terminal sorting domain
LRESYLWGTVYVLIGGKDSVVPARQGCGDRERDTREAGYTGDNLVPTDLYYADLCGNWNRDGDIYYGEVPDDSANYYPEVFVGRVLCSTGQEILDWTNQVLQYEQNPGNGDRNYLTKALFFQSDDMQEFHEAQYDSTSWNSIYNTTIMQEYPSWYDPLPTFPTADQIISQYCGVHYGLWGWFGHGTPITCTAKSAYDNGSPSSQITPGLLASNLTNSNYPAIVYSISCSNTPFDAWDPKGWGWSVGYNLGQAYTLYNSKGGPAFLGNTRYGYVGDSYLLFSQFASLVVSGNTNIGVAELLSKASYGDHYLAYSHNLIGDPEMKIWTSMPQQFANVTITDNGSYITVNSNVSGTNINACSPDGVTYSVTGTNVSVYSFVTTIRPLQITITKKGYIPYMCSYSFTSYNQSIHSDWQMISVPLNTERKKGTNLYPITSSLFYIYSNGYVVRDSLDFGVGYFVKFSKDSTVTITGYAIDSMFVNTINGWQIIGNISGNVSTSNIRTFNTSVTSLYYKYVNGYQPVTTLEQGYGYWVKTNAAGQLKLKKDGLAKTGNVMNNDDLTKSQKLEISNNVGKQTLYFNVQLKNNETKKLYELPPTPPNLPGIFDVRFDDNCFISQNDTGNIIIMGDGPVKFKSSDGIFTIATMEKDGSKKNYSLDASKELELSNNSGAVYKVTLIKNLQPLETIKTFNLENNYPNPFNPTTTIRYALPEDGRVQVKIFDVLGREVALLVDGYLAKGYHTVEWNGIGAASGIYFYSVRYNDKTFYKKMLLLK